MSNDTQLAQPEGSAVALIREAIATKADPVYLRELLAVRDAWESSEARKAFSLAVAQFQKECPIIPKDDMAHNKKYARMDRIWKTVRPISSRLGLSITWQVCELRDDGKSAHIEGALAHQQGHAQPIRMDIPLPETVPGQNSAQRMGSAFTYAQRYAFCAALGVVTGDDADDDANALNNLVTDAQAQELRDLVDAARGVDGFNEKAFYGYAGTDDMGALPQARFEDVRKALKRKIGGSK